MPTRKNKTVSLQNVWITKRIKQHFYIKLHYTNKFNQN
jgi:hypothetical protein